jgi:cytochrome c-type biogenesis protein CcmH
LYKPPLKNSTLLLWFGPFLLLLIALATALKLVRNRADNKVEALDAEQAERLKQLMAEPEKNK